MLDGFPFNTASVLQDNVRFPLQPSNLLLNGLDGGFHTLQSVTKCLDLTTVSEGCWKPRNTVLYCAHPVIELLKHCNAIGIRQRHS